MFVLKPQQSAALNTFTIRKKVRLEGNLLQKSVYSNALWKTYGNVVHPLDNEFKTISHKFPIDPQSLLS